MTGFQLLCVLLLLKAGACTPASRTGPAEERDPCAEQGTALRMHTFIVANLKPSVYGVFVAIPHTAFNTFNVSIVGAAYQWTRQPSTIDFCLGVVVAIQHYNSH